MKFTARKLYYAMPPAWRFAVRRLYYLPLDTWEAVTGQRGGLAPPRGLIYTGGGDFKQSGERTLANFKEFCNLKPSHHVLDVGSGIGRIALPLTQFLDKKNGSYEGFDVVKKGVDWCTQNIAAHHLNFRFRYISLDNDLYRTNGDSAARFRFPYDSDRFDLAIVNSVFTHMLPEEVGNYLGEIHRVMRPGGVCYATFFLFDEKTAWPEGFDFPFDHGHYRLMDDAVKSANVTFEENWLRGLAGQHGLGIRHLFPGSWRGLPKSECKDFQDILVFEKY
ncbi:MAG: class I SAM-dependent methyltransferase [Bacteroidetes bacterium]|nr:class I SAM-dependent methyltransferase [Bacteroidota bacterium]